MGDRVVTPREDQGPTERQVDEEEEERPGWEPGTADQQDIDKAIAEEEAERSAEQATEQPAEPQE